VNLANSHFRRLRLERAYLEWEAGLPRPVRDIDVATRATIRSAMLQLTPRQRAAIVLRFYEDLSERQTADLLGCRPGTVKSLVSQGLERLRSGMSGE
jgi:RNA polymerase sigma factor (sigma-70 family)